MAKITVDIAVPGAYISEALDPQATCALDALEWFSRQVAESPADAIGLIFPETGCLHLVPPASLEKLAACCPDCRALLDAPPQPGRLKVVEIKGVEPIFAFVTLLTSPRATGVN